MTPVSVIEGRAYPFGVANIDTDVIIPARFMKAVDRAGLAIGAFESVRVSGGSVFDDARFQGAPILIAGKNFGCGSSREHAVWALMEMGLRAVIAESFSDIFFGNASGNGLLLVALESDEVARLLTIAQTDIISVDLRTCQIHASTGERFEFVIEPTLRRNLLEGRDPIFLTLAEVDRIAAHEGDHGACERWLA
jgi:3-isopropylmalate/(R)-2-methylmalate dehydratase small subunit